MRAWLERGVEPVAIDTVTPEVETHDTPEAETEYGIDDAIGDARRFRASLADALAMCLEELLRDIAGDVLARELQLAPCDVRAIVERAVERYGIEPVCIRVNPADAHALDRMGAIVVADGQMRGGDVLLEMRHGSIDASLGVRLERVLARCAS